MPPCIRQVQRRLARILMLTAPLALVGCSSTPLSDGSDQGAPPTRVASKAKSRSSHPVLPPAGSGRGGYYMDDGPGDEPPDGLLDTPDAEPRIEPYSSRGNRPYVVFGKSYTPFTDDRPYKARGIASWYGRKFHGQKTSSGELYDMYKMTAAHPTLPIPSYVRVTHLANGKQVIVRVNDRGPFHSGRIIDLSYTAALKLGYLGKGSGEVEVERLLPEEIARMTAEKSEQVALDSAAVSVEAVAWVPAPSTTAIPAMNQLPAAAVTLEKASVVSASATTLLPGFYLQLGAYSQAGNAEAARNRLLQEQAGKTLQFDVVEYGSLHRIYSGPYASRVEAEEAARQLQDRGLAKPLIVLR